MYTLTGSLINLHHVNAKTKMFQRIILVALFANDCAFMVHKESDLQLMVNKFVEATHLFGLIISLGKTEVLLKPALISTVLAPSSSIKGTKLNTVHYFKYLRNVISSNDSLYRDISARICKANQALGCLQSCVLSPHDIQQSLKLKMYRSIGLTSLLYGCETWTLYRRHLNLLECFHIHSMRPILGI